MHTSSHSFPSCIYAMATAGVPSKALRFSRDVDETMEDHPPGILQKGNTQEKTGKGKAKKEDLWSHSIRQYIYIYIYIYVYFKIIF